MTYSHFLGFDHVHFWVGNALQAASYYVTHFGFHHVARSTLETGSRCVMTQVLRLGDVYFAFSSALQPDNQEFASRLAQCGDGVRDVAFTVHDCSQVFNLALSKGAKAIQNPRSLADDFGSVVIATIETGYQGTWHTLVERKNYNGVFLPGYEQVSSTQRIIDPLLPFLPRPSFHCIDHCVSNQPDTKMESVVLWYEKVLSFHRFWSVDDTQIHTDYSSLRSIVVADPSDIIKMPINEPANGIRKSQIQEFVDYFGGPGVQHIALRTTDILATIQTLKDRGVDFIQVPTTYYDNLRKRLQNLSSNSLHIKEDLSLIQQLGILVDFDQGGYLLQIFTRPLQDRPTFFLEVIQRNNHDGFGAGNFKSLFEAIERDQAERRNL